MANRITEILEYTRPDQWRYVDTASNPADDITRGKRLVELSAISSWFQGPTFLYLPHEQWPKSPALSTEEVGTELRKPLFCGLNQAPVNSPKSSQSQFNTWSELIAATVETLSLDLGAKIKPSQTEAEIYVLQQAQMEDFPEEYKLLKDGHGVPSHSRLVGLAPEYDPVTKLIRVGGRLRQSKDLDLEAMYPIVLDPKNHVTKLLVADYDTTLYHPGPQRVFAHLCRKYWVLRGRRLIKKVQRSCLECRKWKGVPSVPRMADLPVIYQFPDFACISLPFGRRVWIVLGL